MKLTEHSNLVIPLNVPAHRDNFRKKLLELERILLTFPQKEFKTTHHFAYGTYARQLSLEAGDLIVGKLHNYSCINIITLGEVMVSTEEGEYHLHAGDTFISGPGVKKVILALAPTIWTTVHPWNGIDGLAELEGKLIAEGYEVLEQAQDKLTQVSAQWELELI